ncbi:MAG: hypothetical protein Q8O93_02215 [bacterium]|nr:hypothetical protein [bacterium]
MFYAKNQADSLNFGHIGWKYYNTIRKKAMEQEFSWSGLLISLSIAFFIVIISAFALKAVNFSIEDNLRRGQASDGKIYYLERSIQAKSRSDINIRYFI